MNVTEFKNQLNRNKIDKSCNHYDPTKRTVSVYSNDYLRAKSIVYVPISESNIYFIQ